MSSNSASVQQDIRASGGAVFGGGSSGNAIPPGPRDIYGYNFTFLAVAPAGVASANITIEQDGDFFLNTINYNALVAAQVTPYQDQTRIIPQILIQMTDQASGRNFFNAPVHIGSLGGTGDRPGRLIHPRKIQRSGTLVVNITSIDPTATYSRIDISLLGFKVYSSNVRVGG